ncbi:MAG: type I glutamate--ammonia ligase [Candidatus Stahlbacteria bacterium]|nr:MAG: type I glutamate--ammonia ligase [Candidatus Stahlbacteria bacterium]
MEKLINELKEGGVEFVDLKLSDLSGRLHHITFPLARLQTALAQGVGFDGSSLGGFRDVAESDLVVKPDTSHLFIDPFYERPTASLYGDIYEPDGQTPCSACPRNILRKVVELIKEEEGVADRIFVLPEFEFYLFDEAEFYLETSASGYLVSSCEAEPPSGLQNAYHITPPTDAFANLRSEMVRVIQEAGIEVKYHHHEVGRYAQAEIETALLDISQAGDAVQTVKYLVKNAARAGGVYATFMPKPLANEAGSGMHIHIQLWKGEHNVFSSESDENELSEIALMFLGGIIKHSRALCAFSNPSTNSYRRLRGGIEAPSRVFHSRANRKAALRVPGYVRGAKDLRFEYRVPDATSNPYLVLAAILLAGLDGVRKGLNPGPLIKNQPEADDDRFPRLPASLTEALGALNADASFLAEQGLFPKELIHKWIKTKEKEIEEIESYPTPAEFVKYFAL